MRTEDADLVLALEEEGQTWVQAVHELHGAPGWPRLMVVMRDDGEYALGSVTGIIVRALPHQDRSYIGVAAEQRLRDLWLPLGEPLRLTPAERAAAAERARERRRAEPLALPQAEAKAERTEPAPFSIPILRHFERGRVWRLSDGQRVVVLDVAPDPFRSPAPPPEILVVTGNDETYERIRKSAPARVRLARAPSVLLAMEAIDAAPPSRILCDESLALGDGGLLERIESERPHMLPALEILCGEGAADWLASYLAKRAPHLRVVEEPLLEEDIEELLDRANKKER